MHYFLIDDLNEFIKQWLKQKKNKSKNGICKKSIQFFLIEVLKLSELKIK